QNDKWLRVSDLRERFTASKTRSSSRSLSQGRRRGSLVSSLGNARRSFLDGSALNGPTTSNLIICSEKPSRRVTSQERASSKCNGSGSDDNPLSGGSMNSMLPKHFETQVGEACDWDRDSLE